jgi:hypothetical protein
MERTTVQRMFHQTLDTHEGGLPGDWWQIFTEATSTLQLRPSVLDCSVDQVLRLVADGADVVLFDPGRGEVSSDGSNSGDFSMPSWILLGHDQKGKPRFWQSSDNETKVFKSSRRLRQRLAELTEDERIRCVAFDWREVSVQANQGTGPAMKPLTRVIQLLRPEWPDIWLVIVFAFVVGCSRWQRPSQWRHWSTRLRLVDISNQCLCFRCCCWCSSS